jgi:subtilisin family serine protease
VPGEVLVRFRSGTPSATESLAIESAGATTLETFTGVPGLRLLRLDPGVTVPDALASFARNPDVRYAQPNQIYRLDASGTSGRSTPDVTTPNDPSFTLQWNWNNTGQIGGTVDDDLDAPEAWDSSTGSRSVVVGVIDTGVDYTHPDLTANMWQNTAECSGTPGVDDDANGYIDDCYGIDTINGDSDPMDDFNHGTHVAGIIGAVGNNGVGVTGLNWRVTILPCKSHDQFGNGTSASVIECFQYMAREKRQFGVNIVVTNSSWGGCPEACGFDQALHDAIAQQQRAGILAAIAAGNNFSDNDAVPVYPATYYLPNIISVAATTNTDSLASFSDWGFRTVGVGAPGQSVYSTLLGNHYGYLSGTSMASPHVAGLAALLAAQDPTRDWRAIRNLILAGGEVKGALVGKTLTGRRINANGSLNCSNTPIFGVVRPLVNEALANSPLTIAVLNINCAAPAGGMTVTITPGGQSRTLRDRGKNADLAKGDGIYSASWTPAGAGTYTLSFSNGQSTTIHVS